MSHFRSIQFRSFDGDIISSFSKLQLTNNERPFDGIPKTIIPLVADRRLTKGALSTLTFTELLRVATINAYAAEMVMAHFGYRPLQLNAKYNLFAHQIESLRWMKEMEAQNKMEQNLINIVLIVIKMANFS